MNGVNADHSRVDWVDHAKGFYVVLVVTTQATLGIELAGDYDGWLHPPVMFARPFLFPGFFLIAALFLPLVIDRPWRSFLDRKVIRFGYFYLLWMTIQFAAKAPAIAAEQGAHEAARLYLLALIDPPGTLWFIYLLPIFFVFVRLMRRVPPVTVWLFAAALEISHLHTGWTVPDEFAAHFIYFFSGYILSPHIFRIARSVQRNPLKGILLLALWAPANGFMVYLGYWQLPGVSLALGLTGAAALIRLSALLPPAPVFKPLLYCGRHAIVIYLAFFLPVTAAQSLLLGSEIISGVGTMSAVVTVAGLIVPLCVYWLVRKTPARFLFERPRVCRLASKHRAGLQPAE